MSELTYAMGLVIPYVNLVLVAVVLLLFFKLFKTYKHTKIGYITPWAILCFGVLVYVAEAIFTVLRASGVFDLPYHVNGYFELIIISAFIYAVLNLRDHLKNEKKGLSALFSVPAAPAPSKKAMSAPKKAVKKSAKKPSSKKRKTSTKKKK